MLYNIFTKNVDVTVTSAWEKGPDKVILNQNTLHVIACVVPIYHEEFLTPRCLHSLCFPILKCGMQLCH